jgi:hypothetical protein
MADGANFSAKAVSAQQETEWAGQWLIRMTRRNSVQSLQISTIRLYEEQLRIHGRVTLSRSNAEMLLASRELRITPDPDRPGLVRVERSVDPKPFE